MHWFGQRTKEQHGARSTGSFREDVSCRLNSLILGRIIVACPKRWRVTFMFLDSGNPKWEEMEKNSIYCECRRPKFVRSSSMCLSLAAHSTSSVQANRMTNHRPITKSRANTKAEYSRTRTESQLR